MRQGALSALSAMAIVACAVSSSNAQQDEARQWRLTKDDDGHAALAYGTESAEDVSIVFDCNPRSGAIRVFVAETNASLKPNRSINATIKAGATTSIVRGKTIPNEEAGVPSFEGTMPATDPLLGALSKAKALSIDVGAAHEDVPLQDIGGKGNELASLCRKP